ncbi:MAG: GNAT family N-acetyltransferase [Firmicutes bacterium]|nr:GNAT family N-acetyltransferase [Bacillota bacterium]
MKNGELKLVKPTKENTPELEAYKEAISKTANMHGVSELDVLSVAEWLQKCEDYWLGINLPDGYVPASQFVAVRQTDGKIVGSVNLRHRLSEHLLNSGGHIGYMVAHDERQKGYAKEMLRLCLPEAKKLGIDRVLVTCKKANEASRRTILANGGVLENEIPYNGEILQRYWINNK